jgi:hypothetical protein
VDCNSASFAVDRCHLNGLALEAGRTRYLSCLGETNSEPAWKAGKATGGCVIDVFTGKTVLSGLSMPHSPRVHQGRLWFLEDLVDSHSPIRPDVFVRRFIRSGSPPSRVAHVRRQSIGRSALIVSEWSNPLTKPFKPFTSVISV